MLMDILSIKEDSKTIYMMDMERNMRKLPMFMILIFRERINVCMVDILKKVCQMGRGMNIDMMKNMNLKRERGSLRIFIMKARCLRNTANRINTVFFVQKTKYLLKVYGKIEKRNPNHEVCMSQNEMGV